MTSSHASSVAHSTALNFDLSYPYLPDDDDDESCVGDGSPAAKAVP